MSIPDSFSVFSPEISLFKLLTPTEYLTHTNEILQKLPSWQKLAAITATVCLGILLCTLAMSYVIDEDRQSFDHLSTIEHTLSILTKSSALTFIIASILFIAIPLGVSPYLTHRVEWLQTII